MKNEKHRHTRFVVVMTMICVLAIALVITIIMSKSEPVRDIFAKIVIKKTLDQAEKKISGHFTRIPATINAGSEWLAAGDLDLNDVIPLNEYFIPILKRLPQLSGVVVADDEGCEYFVYADEATWITRSIDRKHFDQEVIFRRWDTERHMIAEWAEESEYVTKQRPWYEGALKSLQSGTPYWTDVYQFYTKKKVGITASKGMLYGPQNERFIIVAVDVLLDDVRQAITKVSLSKNALVALASDKGEFITSSTADELMVNDELVVPQKFMNGNRGVLLNIAIGRANAATAGAREELFELSLNETKWWVAYRKLSIVDDNILIVIAIPKNEIFELFKNRRELIAIGVAGIIVVLSVVWCLLTMVSSRRL